MTTLSRTIIEAKATYCGRCGTTHVPPSKGGKCPALKETSTKTEERKMKTLSQFMEESHELLDEADKMQAHMDRVKKLKGKQVTFTHATTKKKVTGTLQKITNMGGMPYAHVETGTSAHRVPLHQID